MYLEISARQSGKTTRLLNELEKYSTLSENNKSVVFSANHACQEHLKNGIRELKYSNVKFMIANEVSLCGQSFEQDKLFFDEFDFFTSTFWTWLFYHTSTNRTIDNAYFTTTPRKIRKMKELKQLNSNDIMAKLLQLTNFSWASYDTVLQKHHMHMLSPEQYMLEIEGMFIK